MPIKMPKLPFRNEQIFFIDAKQINLDRTLVNLYVLLKHNGGRTRSRVSQANKQVGEKELMQVFRSMEEAGQASGIKENQLAVRGWLRANLMDMVYRGQGPEKENFTSLKPIHLFSYRIRNQKHTRDYNSADQVYSMLSVKPAVREELQRYLSEGWDETSKTVSPSALLDIDSLGLLRMIDIVQKTQPDATGDAKPVFDKIGPLLPAEAATYCDDVHRLLQYRHVIPRHVLLDYLKTLTGFHLSLYLLRLIRYVPELVSTGQLPAVRPLDIVLDVTDSPDTEAGQLAMDDASQFYNSLPDYVRAVFAINNSLAALPFAARDLPAKQRLELAVKAISGLDTEFVGYCRQQLSEVYKGTPDELHKTLDDLVALETDDVNRYLAVFLYVRGAWHQLYHTNLLDSLLLKNTENGMLAQGKSRRHKRRFVLGTRLLEALVQISVLRTDDATDSYYSTAVSIEDFTAHLHQRYGIVINGLGLPRFQDADLRIHEAFSENVEALKYKLRQIGFYTQLSDAYLLQKIRPRYTLNSQPA
ncbi:hypothetical protein GCM10022408_29890 [Hymenobacter fastidiosus]|uniref:Uncharacterized protein n=1 Tax=Hymenobacter fastidiosus TaxID=486264 RepID=A0ABP7SQU8_9BACT